MKKTVFTFACPCCGKSVEVDTRSGKARAVRPEENKGQGDLDTLLAAHKRESDRLDDLFSSARDRHEHEGDHLERELRRAKKEAEKDSDERPPNIFDLD
ncbi:MAG: hypothetical protein KDE27_16540 [Planctomycetes bacterium]|nr:hypothetical protein [Planctomycetota bacterium]